MAQTDLFGQPIKPKRKRNGKRKTTRTQSRAPSWQNTHDPTLHRHALFASVNEDYLDGIPPYLHDIARQAIANLERPVSLPPGTREQDARDVMSVVYRLRLDFRSQLYVEGDPKSERDYVMSLSELCKLYREEMLAEKGFRSAAHGISEVKDAQGNLVRYRVQAWGETNDTKGGIRIGHIHAGYCDTLEEAYKLQAEWWLKNHKIDISKIVCYSPESAIAELAEMMRDAAINAGNNREDTVEVTPDVIYGDDDD